MRATTIENRGGRLSGRGDALLALGVALVALGGIGWWLLSSNEALAPAPAPAAGNAAPGAEGPSSGASTAETARGAISGGELSGEAPAPESAPDRTSGDAAEGEAAPTGAVIEGRVLSASGEPLEGASLWWLSASAAEVGDRLHDGGLLPPREAVTAGLPEPFRRAAGEAISATAQADGHYRIELPKAKLRGVIVAEATGHARSLREVAKAPASKAGTPPAETPPTAPSAAAASGGPPAPPPATASRSVTINFRLGPGGAISGRVTDRESGDPAEAMEVIAGRSTPDTPEFLAAMYRGAVRAVVDQEGRYALRGLEPGEYRVAARSGRSDYAPVPLEESRRVVLEAGAEIEGVDFEVGRGGAIAGVVVDQEGSGVEGASVNLAAGDFLSTSWSGNVEAAMSMKEMSGRTGPDGRFEIRGLPIPGKYRPAVQARDWAPAGAEEVELTADSPRAEIEIELSRGWSIRGVAVHEDGTPAPGIEVRFMPDLEKLLSGALPMNMSRQAKSDAAGAFELTHLAAGEYTLQAGSMSPAVFFPGGQKGTRVTVESADVEGVRLVVARGERGEITGTVVDTSSAPVEGAELSLQAGAFGSAIATGEKVRSSEQGRFRLQARGKGPFRVVARKEGYTKSTSEELPPGASGIVLVLVPEGRIRGRVVVSPGAPPPPGGKVRALPAEVPSATQRLQALARRSGKSSGVSIEADGSFEIGAPAGPTVLHADVPGYAPGRSEPVDVAPGDLRVGVTIRLVRGATVRGRVTGEGEDSGGLAGAAVRVRPARPPGERNAIEEMLPQFTGDARSRTTSEADGHWELDHLAPGAYTIAVSHEEYAPAEPVRVTLREDQVLEVSAIHLVKGGAIAGRVVEAGEPKAGIMVQLMGGGPLRQAVTKADGSFGFEGLKPGEYAVNAVDVAAMQKGRMRMKSRVVKIEAAAGTAEEIEFVFGTGHSIRGKVTGLPEAPMRVITLRKPGGPAPEELDPLAPDASLKQVKYQGGAGFIRPDGGYEIPEVEPGKYILEIPKMPSDPTDLEAFRSMDRTPHYRAEITVRDRDLEHDIEVRPGKPESK